MIVSDNQHQIISKGKLLLIFLINFYFWAVSEPWANTTTPSFLSTLNQNYHQYINLSNNVFKGLPLLGCGCPLGLHNHVLIAHHTLPK